MRRVRIEKGAIQNFPVTATNKSKKNHLTIYKATEAANGAVLFAGTNEMVIKRKV